VLAGPKESDRWYVLGRRVTEEQQVLAQRTWLWGLDTGRQAVIVDFARPGAAFAWALWPGNILDADLARFPGSAPLRVLVADRRGDPQAAASPAPGWATLADVAAARSDALQTDPWLERWPLSVDHLTPRVHHDTWSVTDSAGDQLPLIAEDETAWRLLAVSAGRPVHLIGEWDEESVHPLAAWTEDRMVAL
jgi:hypothetical protein